MPATETDFEREFAELVAQLREVPAKAPDSLRARVRTLGEPEGAPTLRDRISSWHWRRTVVFAVPACVAALLSVAVVRGVVSSGPGRESRATLTTVAPVHSGTTRRGPFSAGASGRPVDVDASLHLRVPDLDALGDRTAEAMRIARSLGGYVASVQQTTTAGEPGEADLLLKIPVARVDTALIRLAGLGTVLDQSLSVVDLQQTLAEQRRQIRNLRLQVVRLQQALRNQSLPADVRLRLQFQLEETRQTLARLTRANKATRRQAALSDVSLALTTPRAAGAATGHDRGRAERAVRDAASFLAAAGAVALFVLIAVSPLLLLAAVWAYGTRAYRRREERRLLASTPE
jgi:hypothetical protein